MCMCGCKRANRQVSKPELKPIYRVSLAFPVGPEITKESGVQNPIVNVSSMHIRFVTLVYIKLVVI